MKNTLNKVVFAGFVTAFVAVPALALASISTSGGNTGGADAVADISTSGGNTGGADAVKDISTSGGDTGGADTITDISTSGGNTGGADTIVDISTSGGNTGGADTSPVTTGSKSTGGSSSFSSSGGRVILLQTGSGAVVPSSCPLITTFMKFGIKNDTAEVSKLQSFLKTVENLDVDINGTFDLKTENAVKAFQSKYLATIMGPWQASRPSGYVYITTAKKINELACNRPITLSSADEDVIKAYNQKKIASTTTNTNATEQVGPSPVTPGADNTPATVEVGTSQNTNTAAVGKATVAQRLWSFFKNLFKK